MKHFDEILYVPTNIDMMEIGMEIYNQFGEDVRVKVVYEEDEPEWDIKENDVIGIYTVDDLRKELGDFI